MIYTQKTSSTYSPGSMIGVASNKLVNSKVTVVKPVSVVPGVKSSETNNQVMIRLGSSEPDSYQILRVIEYLGRHFSGLKVMRDAALRIIGDAGDHNVDVQLSRIADFVKSMVRYVRDPIGSEYVVSPFRLLLDIYDNGYVSGDCDDHVLLLNSLLGSIGFDVRPIGVHLYDQNLFDHVISNVMVDGKWVDVDPCAKDVPTPEYGDRLVVET